jgi:hypothetical protein
MSDGMTTRQRQELDNWITGHYGEDEFVNLVVNLVCEHCRSTYADDDEKCQNCGWPLPESEEDEE